MTKPKSGQPRRRIPTWKVVENTVAAIWTVKGASASWRVKANARIATRTDGRRRQVDVFVECPTGDTVFRVGIDVKNEKHPLDIESVEQLCAKGKRLDIDRYVIVSTSGFTKPALDLAHTSGVAAIRLTKAALNSVFAITHLEHRVPRLLSILALFADGAQQPSAEELKAAKVHTSNGQIGLLDVPSAYISQALQDHPELSDGRVAEIVIEDRDGHWQRLEVDQSTFDAPRGLRVRFQVDTELLPGHSFSTDQHGDAFSVLVPVQGALRQLTLVTGPPTADGRSLSLTISDPSPKPTDV